jgi:hypothetical protein
VRPRTHPTGLQFRREKIEVLNYMVQDQDRWSDRWLDQVARFPLQWLFMVHVYERYVKNSVQDFVDICSLANISVFILALENYGFYIHGRWACIICIRIYLSYLFPASYCRLNGEHPKIYVTMIIWKVYLLAYLWNSHWPSECESSCHRLRAVCHHHRN